MIGVTVLVTVVPASTAAAQETGPSGGDPGLPTLPLPGPGPDTETQPAPATAPEAQPAASAIAGSTAGPAVPLRGSARAVAPVDADGRPSVAPAVPIAPAVPNRRVEPATARPTMQTTPMADDMTNLVGVVAGLVLVLGAGAGVVFAGRRRNALAAAQADAASAFSRR